MQSKQFLLAITFSLILSGMALSQCTSSVTPSNSDNNNSISSENEFIADTSMSDTGKDGSMPPGNNGTQNQDTTSNGSTDTTQQNGNDGSMGSDTGMQSGSDGSRSDTSTQNQHDGIRDGAATTTPKFNSQKVDTIQGHVLSVDTLSSDSSNREITLTLKESDGTTDKIYLAPETFIKDLNLKINKDDSVTIAGFKSTAPQNTNTYVASKLIKNGATYLFRDEKGSPFWPESRQ